MRTPIDPRRRGYSADFEARLRWRHDMSDLRTRLASVPDPTLDRRPEIERAIAHSVEYLGSDAAQRSLDQDTYWPKWNSPWWHLVLLYELGEERRIPERARWRRWSKV